MAYPTFVYSPLPAALERTPQWGETITQYDSGAQQGQTAYTRPLYTWGVSIKLMTETKQPALLQFVNSLRGQVGVFLMKDAYDFRVASVLSVASGVTQGSSLFVYDTNSYTVRPDTLFIGSMASALSGYVRLGTQYSIDQDTGILTVNTKAVNDIWGVRSLEYFRKVRLNAPYKDTSALWNTWTSNLTIQELP